MENQHRKINGYRELTPEEIELMNEAKHLAAQCGELLERLNNIREIDKRSINIGKTNLQQGFMWVVRGIARPSTF